jgi:site-specific DNA-cytosine methylase
VRNIILDLCGGTGAWSRPYREAGYDVKLITLPDYSVTDVVFGGDYMVFNKQAYNVNDMGTNYVDIVGVFAAPPCTEFSVAKGNRPRNLAQGMEVVEACMRIIWQTQLHTRLDFWAMENPRGLLRRFLGVPRYTFEQWQFGADRVKATDVWGYFNHPTPTHNTRPDPKTSRKGRTHAAEWSRLEYPPEYDEYIRQFHGDARRAAARAVTPDGFARAFFKANSRGVIA